MLFTNLGVFSKTKLSSHMLIGYNQGLLIDCMGYFYTQLEKNIAILSISLFNRNRCLYQSLSSEDYPEAAWFKAWTRL
jgi:hypothetical protein